MDVDGGGDPPYLEQHAAPPQPVMPMGHVRFGAIAAEYLRHRALYTDDRQTMAFQVQVLDRHFGELALDAITAAEIETFLASRLAAGVSRSTCNRNRSALSVIMAWAVGRGYCARNPVTAVKRFREIPAETRVLTAEQIGALTLAAEPHLKAYLVTLAYTGGRMTETLQMRWGWIDFRAGTITFVGRTTKGRRTRVVPMVEPLRRTLLALPRGGPEDLVFTYNGRGVKSMRRALLTAARRAGLPHIGFHTLRHSFATQFVRNDGPVALLQRILGHSTIGLTMRYVQFSRDYLLSAARFIGPKKGRGERDSESGDGEA